ncbi:unnamed protein product [Ectocarpus sp. 12 AP-2014]
MPQSRDGKHTFCVYGSSSVNTPQPYLDVARKLGNLLADGGHTCVNGAGRAGCMGALNDGVTERCGRVRGVIHEMWIVDASEHPQVEDLRVVGGQGLQERKRILMEGADCIVALPGGLGTWDELWEMVCLKGIGLCDVPICVLDVDDFYAGFKVQTKRAQADRLLYSDMDKLLHFESDPAKAVEWCVSQLGAPGRDHKPNRRLKRTTSGVYPPTKKSWSNPDRLLWACSVIACSGALTLAMTALRR